MLDYFDLRKGTIFILEGEPFEVLEFNQMKKAQREGIAQTRIKSLVSGRVMERNFHDGDRFQEADLQKLKAKYLYSHPDSEQNARYIGRTARYKKSSISSGASRARFFFCEADNPSKRFDLGQEQIGEGSKFLKANEIVEALIFEEKIIKISLPIKVRLKVTEAPPGIKGDRAQGGVKTVVLETGAQINVPLFVETGDMVEINTETGEYARRIDQ